MKKKATRVEGEKTMTEYRRKEMKFFLWHFWQGNRPIKRGAAFYNGERRKRAITRCFWRLDRLQLADDEIEAVVSITSCHTK